MSPPRHFRSSLSLAIAFSSLLTFANAVAISLAAEGDIDLLLTIKTETDTNVANLADISTVAVDDLQPRWTIIPGDDLTKGACSTDRIDKLQESYREAREMMVAAKQAITDLRQPRPTDEEQGKEWDRKYKMFHVMFGVKLDPAMGGADDPWLPSFEEDFGKMIQAATAPGSKSDIQQLACGVGYLKFVGTSDPDPTGDGKKRLSDLHPDYKLGAWYDTRKDGPTHNLLMENKKNLDDEQKSNPDRIFCQVTEDFNTQAVTFPIIFKTMHWCPSGGLEQKTIINPEAYWVDPDQTKLDDIKTMSTIWVHELAHFASNGDIGDPDSPNGSSGINGQVYDFEACKAYAANQLRNKDYSERAADAYSLFAKAIFLKDFDWSDGTARHLDGWGAISTVNLVVQRAENINIL